MNKTHWLGILLDGSAADETVTELLDLSYRQTQPKKGVALDAIQGRSGTCDTGRNVSVLKR